MQKPLLTIVLGCVLSCAVLGFGQRSWLSGQEPLPPLSPPPYTGEVANPAPTVPVLSKPEQNRTDKNGSGIFPTSAILAPDFEGPDPGPGPKPETLLYRLINRLIPEKDRDPSPAADINLPGPDTANFPNSPFTLPKGRGYIEVSPFNFGQKGNGTPQEYSIPFLLRFGLTDNVELRMYSIGYTWVNGTPQTSPQTTTGLSPLIFDLKVHLWGEKEWMWWPIFGLEVYIQSEIGSPAFVTGVESGISLLVDHNLPNNWLLEWNVGDFGIGFPGAQNDVAMNLGFSWALQKQITEKWAGFFQGFYNQPDLPFFAENMVVGLGFQWNLAQRVSLYGSYNWSLNKVGNPTISYAGFAYAF